MSLVVSRRAALRLIATTVTLAAALAPRPGLAQLFNFPDWYTLANACSNNKPGEVAYLLRRGDNPNFVDPDGRTPLDYAAEHGNTEIIKMLLDGGARIDYRDKFGSTALHWAAERGHAEAVEMLVAAKAPVDAQNRQGISPLMLAASGDKAEVVKLLLKAGADPKKQDYTGRDALGWAADRPNALRVLHDATAG
jgi:uncharacterized protein